MRLKIDGVKYRLVQYGVWETGVLITGRGTTSCQTSRQSVQDFKRKENFKYKRLSIFGYDCRSENFLLQSGESKVFTSNQGCNESQQIEESF